jgi:hypothetical protein
VGDKKSLWANKVESHNKKQALNPFSDKFDASLSRTLLSSKDDPEYGRPEAHSLSSLRARAGEAKMRAEICDMCDVIFAHGQRSADGTAAITFGPLFSVSKSSKSTVNRRSLSLYNTKRKDIVLLIFRNST